MKIQYIVTLLFLGGSLSLISFLVWNNAQTTTELRSKAAEITNQSIPTIVPRPQTVLTAPYLRLVHTKQEVKVGDSIPVDVYMKTGVNPVVAASVAVSYDPSEFLLEQTDIQNVNVFPVISVDSQMPGKTLFSLFITEEAGYEPITNTNELLIARLLFHVVGDSKRTSTIEIEFDTNESSGLYGPRDQTGEISPNLLQSVEGAVITVL